MVIIHPAVVYMDAIRAEVYNFLIRMPLDHFTSTYRDGVERVNKPNQIPSHMIEELQEMFNEGNQP